MHTLASTHARTHVYAFHHPASYLDRLLKSCLSIYSKSSDVPNPTSKWLKGQTCRHYVPQWGNWQERIHLNSVRGWLSKANWQDVTKKEDIYICIYVYWYFLKMCIQIKIYICTYTHKYIHIYEVCTHTPIYLYIWKMILLCPPRWDQNTRQVRLQLSPQCIKNIDLYLFWTDK